MPPPWRVARSTARDVHIMAVFPPYFPNLVEVRIAQTMPGGAAAVNVLYVERDGTDTFAIEGTEITNAFITLYTTLGGTLSDQWSTDEVTVIDRSVAAGAQINTGVSIVGADTNDALPSQTQAVVTLKTGFTGRRYRGRVFIGGWGSANTDTDGEMIAAVPTFLLAEFGQLATDLLVDGHVLQVLSRGNTAPPAPVAWTAFHTPVTSFAVNRRWDVLRSRRQ